MKKRPALPAPPAAPSPQSQLVALVIETEDAGWMYTLERQGSEKVLAYEGGFESAQAAHTAAFTAIGLRAKQVVALRTIANVRL